MRLNYLAYSFSLTIMYFSFILFFPIIIAFYYHETYAILPFLFTGTVALMISTTIKKIIKETSAIKSINDIKKSEGLCIVTFSWIFAVIFASVPFLFFGMKPIDALFEATSGITATGATILTHFDYPNTIFFWRSFTQWLGGMGIIVLVIAILPQFAIAGRQMFFAEAPGPTEDKFTPRIKSTASALWKIYAGLTLLEFILLKFNGFSGFDALCHSLSTLSGGGLSPRSNSLAGCPTQVLWIITCFMLFAGTSFNLQYKVWTKFNPFLLFKNEEFRTYFSAILFIGVLLSFSLFFNMNYNFTDSITHSFFNTVSLISTTGFCSVDYTKWDYTSKLLLFTIMLVGSCASSAGGGLKVVRWLLVFKIMKTELIKILHPKAIFNIKIGNYSVSKEILYQTLMFVAFYFGILALSAILISLLEQNTTIGITGAISSIGNIGPGFGIIGPMGNFESMHPLTKSIMILGMLIGRLELIPFLVLFQKDFWSIKK